MKVKKFNSIVLIGLLLGALVSTSCDESFYLSEREFYALQTQIAREDYAEMFFGDVQGEMLRITFDNSTAPPRVQSSNLLDFMRAHLTTFALLEGFPFYYFQGDRVSGEFEKQLDNFLADRLRLYAGGNNAEARLTRVDEMRVTFLNNPTFVYSPDKISFDTTLRIGVDCTAEISALDPLSNIIFGGVNGTHNVVIDVQTLRVQGEFFLDETGTKESKWRFRMTPQAGTVAVGERGVAVPNAIKTGIAKVVKQNLSVPVDQIFEQKYEHFTLNDCRVSGQNNNFTCDYNSHPSFSNPELHEVARGTDNKLYARHRRDNVWSGYDEVVCCSTGSPVQASFTSDPSLAVSGAQNVELAATTTSGAIFYAQHNSFWGKQLLVAPTIPPNTPPNSQQNYWYRGKPAIVATAPGQLEIIAGRGASGNPGLVHLRRINGVWSAPVALSFPATVGTFPNVTFVAYRDPIAVQSGNKILLVTGASNNKLYAMVFDLETGVWSQFSQIQTTENVAYAPTLAASGDGRVNLVYVGQSGAIYHRPLDVMSANITNGVATSGYSFAAETNIGGTVNAAPVLFASGYRQLGLVARGMDNRLYYNHFVGTHSIVGWVDGRNVVQGWQGWNDLNGNFIGTQILSSGQMDEFAATATKTGKLDVVARIRPNSAENSTLHHNSYDAARYGTKPWKTVHWRGYQKFSSRQFVGRPAIAALDMNLEVAYVGQNSNIFQTEIGASFIQRTNFQIFSNAQNVPAPLVVTSGKGLVDIIAVGSDQKIRHLRQFNRAALTSATLPGQAALSFQRRPAVVDYGEGQIDVIGVSTAGTIYHWRNLNGVWQNPRQLSGTVSSPPILVSTGSGQLEFLALGGDNKLYRWRFTNGAWGSWQQLPSTFTMNPNYFGQGSATTWGDGTVDLAVVRIVAGTLVYHRHIEPRDDTVALPNQPAQTFQNIGSGAGDQPFIAAAASNLKIVVVKDAFSSDFREFSFGWRGWQTLGLPNPLGVQTSGFLIDASGYKLLATDVNGRAYLCRSWFSRDYLLPVPEQIAATQLRLPLFRPAFASHGGQ